MTNEPEPNTRPLPQPSELVDLIERLESHMGKQDPQILLADCREAALELRAQSAQIAKLQAKAENYQIERAELLADISDMMANHVENWPSPKKPKTAVALIDKTFHAQTAQLAKLQADGDKLAGALERSRQGWSNVLELGLLPVQHQSTALGLQEAATQALTEWKDRA